MKFTSYRWELLSRCRQGICALLKGTCMDVKNSPEFLLHCPFMIDGMFKTLVLFKVQCHACLQYHIHRYKVYHLFDGFT